MICCQCKIVGPDHYGGQDKVGAKFVGNFFSQRLSAFAPGFWWSLSWLLTIT